MLFSLIEKLKKVKDFRSGRGKRHQLHQVLIILILGIMLGNVTYKQLDFFAKANAKSLTKGLKLAKTKLPSYGTIRRIIRGVDWKEIQEVFREWVEEIYPYKEEQDWLAIDGKSLRSTLKNSQDEAQNFVTIVSLYSQKTGLVLDVEKFETKKSSEIAVAQEMVRKYPDSKKVFTLDALHCNQKLTEAIIESKNDYVIPIKTNRIKLYTQIKKVTESEKPLSRFSEKEKKHGRETAREIEVFAKSNIEHKTSKNLASISQVTREGIRQKKTYRQKIYYLSSIIETAENLGKIIRGHWEIENKLHWVKDVIFQEDNLRIKEFQAAANFSLLITIAMNYFRSLGFESIREGQNWLKNKWYKLVIVG